MRKLRAPRWLADRLWPSFDCELCLGQYPGQGCYCSYNGATQPGGPPPWWVEQLRRVFHQ